jgi:hypothetical protein
VIGGEYQKGKRKIPLQHLAAGASSPKGRFFPLEALSIQSSGMAEGENPPPSEKNLFLPFHTLSPFGVELNILIERTLLPISPFSYSFVPVQTT